MHLVAGCQCSAVQFSLNLICHKLLMLKLFTFKHVWLHQHMVADYQCTDVVPIFLVVCNYMLNSAVLVSAFDSLNEPIFCVILGASTPLRLYVKPEKR